MVHPTDDEISLKDVLLKARRFNKFLLSNSKLIAAFILVFALSGWIYTFLQKPIYKATLSFALEDDKGGGGLGGALGLASQMGLDLGSGGSAFSGNNLIALMKSRSMVEKALLNPVEINHKTISLAELYSASKGGKWASYLTGKNRLFAPKANRKTFTMEQDSMMGILSEQLIKDRLFVVLKEETNSIIEVNVLSENQLFSKYFTEALATEVSKFYIETKSKKAKLNLENLMQQRDSVKLALNAAIVGVAVANDNTFNLNPSQNINRVPSIRRQVDVQANTAILTELVKNLEMAKVTLRKETPLIQIIDYPILPLKKEQTGPLKGALIGAILGGFFALLFLIIKKAIQIVRSVSLVDAPEINSI